MRESFAFEKNKAYENDTLAIKRAKKHRVEREFKKSGTEETKEVGKTRRDFLKDLGVAVMALGVVAGGSSLEKTARKTHKYLSLSENERKDENTRSKKEVEKLRQKLREQSLLEREDGLEKFTFLESKENKQKVSTGKLSGKKFADLYAEYLGIKDGSIVPEKLDVDFKANLASLWRRKFGFDASGRTQEEEISIRKKFLHKHKDLMVLAERLYSSYNQDTARKVPLFEYAKEITSVTNQAHGAFMHAMYELRRDHRFPRERRSVIERLAKHIGYEKLLACSLTELMPSRDGKINATVLDFLLRNAGASFVNRIPAVHDMLASFGPYQLTPAIFAPGGSGNLSEKMEEHLPKGFMPKTVDDVSGKDHHKVAYIVAIEHLTQIVGKFSRHELKEVEHRIAHTSPEVLHKEVLTFIAMSHHRPEEAYSYFKKILLQRPVQHASMVDLSIRHVRDRGLRQYAHKAIANYDFLATPGALRKV